jgi:hypothetical protein
MTNITPDLRQRIWAALDKLVREHRSFPDANWVLPAAELDRLSLVANRLRPQNPEEAHRWLFDEHMPRLDSDARDYEARDREVNEQRRRAVDEIARAGGPEAVLKFAHAVKQPGLVARAAADAGLELDDLALSLLDSSDEVSAFFATAYGFAKTARLGPTWTHAQIARVDGRPLAKARLLRGADDLREAWSTAKSLGPDVEREYWKEFRIEGHGAEFTFVHEAASSLMRFGRTFAAIDLMSMYASRADRPFDPELVAEALETLITTPPESSPEQGRVSAYEIGELLDYLREAKFDDTRLAMLEWRLLPTREFNAQSPALDRLLARDPSLFVELVSLLYKPHGDDSSRTVDQNAVRNAYRLLNEWSVTPGTNEERTVDEKALEAWVTEARQRLNEAKRREVGDMHIGKVLARAPEDPDGTWPTHPVRTLIERLASTDIESGMGSQILNDRGVTTRGLLDGGAQERTLAERWRDRAQRIRDGWPRTAAVLDSVATSYEHQAREHDAESERTRQGLRR